MEVLILAVRIYIMKSFCLTFVLYLLFVLIGDTAAQEIYAGLGVISEKSSGTPYLDLNSIVVYENNRFDDKRLFISVFYSQPISTRLDGNIGIQYRLAFFDLFAYQKTNHPIGPASKGTGVALPTFEVPLSLSFSIVERKNYNFQLMAGLMPVFNGINGESNYKADPNSLDWTQPVADALNAASTIPKSFYMNYQYGISLSFKRFKGMLYWHRNLSKSTTKSLELWGESYPFVRHTQSFRFSLYYRVWAKK